MFEEMNEKLTRVGVIPVIVINDAKDAMELGKSLSEAGMNCAEVTFRTAAAEETIRIIAKNYPDIVVGAGTVFTKEQVDVAVNAGAKFIDCPIMDEEVVDYCIGKNIPVYPGITTPSEAAKGVKRGLKILKFFPAEANGGLAMLEAMSAVFKDLRFFPMGGIDKENMRRYLSS
ncbi:MAG: bifunctional 4-hydroxy-2-oxoglutarate aldolase/2-dehydro-3-deoxy-phosphogluconate aldolase, partial [Eubacteriales bacterium]|nr:bifunctional 4-hydroxy-2-oxoglutarate aldolase/2-dehydro-3-deoxy-phosphogluconate aldolase [Eubacteriales bacterium]